MSQGGFLTDDERAMLKRTIRRPTSMGGAVRRANVILLLDSGMSVEEAARVMFLDDDTVRVWRGKWKDKGGDALDDHGWKGSLNRPGFAGGSNS